MSNLGNVVSAFSEDHVERLTGLTKSQLRYWDRTGFFAPSYADEDRRQPFSRLYSFRDVVGLKTLAILRNQHKVPLQHLRQVAKSLSHLKDELWIKTVLYVQGRKVIFSEEDSGRLREAVSGQYVNGLALKRVISDAEKAAEKLRERPADQVGLVERNRFVARNALVISGTRIPVKAIKRFHEAGYSIQDIQKEYPSLTVRDISAAISHDESKSSAA